MELNYRIMRVKESLRMTNKRGIMRKRGKKSVESVGEHVQASDDQGWVQLEV